MTEIQKHLFELKDDMYADYINGTKEISECNEAFKAEYYTNL